MADDEPEEWELRYEVPWGMSYREQGIAVGRLVGITLFIVALAMVIFAFQLG